MPNILHGQLSKAKFYILSHPPTHLFVQHIMISFYGSSTLQDTEDSKNSSTENLG